jgi:hypothetical protein
MDQLTPIEQADRAAAVILNKVKNLRWFYFDVDLERDFDRDISKQQPDLSVLLRIEDHQFEDHNSRYKWIGTESDRRKLLPCLLFVLRTNPEITRQLFLRIFDLNEVPTSPANKGGLGVINWLTTWQRASAYRKNVTKQGAPIRVVADGDSWFQYPFPAIGLGRFRWDMVKDIVDHLMADNMFRVDSLARGGDWLSTMLQAGRYVTEISRIQPDFFVFSGGGDDLTVDGRVAFMVRKPNTLDIAIARLVHKRANESDSYLPIDLQKYDAGLHCLTWEFFSLLNLVFLEYLLLIQSTSHEKLKHLVMITHGYDFLRPRRNNPYWYRHGPVQWIENWCLAGSWLWIPMEEKKLDEPSKQNVAYTIIYEFNEMLISLAKHSGHPNLFHIDCRGLAKPEDWYDELHLTSEAFGVVTRLYRKCMQMIKANRGCTDGIQKVFDGRDL